MIDDRQNIFEVRYVIMRMRPDIAKLERDENSEKTYRRNRVGNPVQFVQYMLK